MCRRSRCARVSPRPAGADGTWTAGSRSPRAARPPRPGRPGSAGRVATTVASTSSRPSADGHRAARRRCSRATTVSDRVRHAGHPAGQAGLHRDDRAGRRRSTSVAADDGVPAPRSAMIASATCGGRGREVVVDPAFEAAGGLGAEPVPPRGVGDVTGSNDAASSTTSVVSARISVAAPPITPASAIGPLSSAMTRSRGIQRPVDVVEGAQPLPRRRPPHHDRPAQAGPGRRRAAAGRHRASRSW